MLDSYIILCLVLVDIDEYSHLTRVSLWGRSVAGEGPSFGKGHHREGPSTERGPPPPPILIANKAISQGGCAEGGPPPGRPLALGKAPPPVMSPCGERRSSGGLPASIVETTEGRSTCAGLLRGRAVALASMRRWGDEETSTGLRIRPRGDPPAMKEPLATRRKSDGENRGSGRRAQVENH